MVLVARNCQVDLKLCVTRYEDVRCKWAARAGVETASAVLSEDLRSSDSLTDAWSYNEQDFNNIELEGAFFKVQVEDEASKLNVNTATREQLMAMPYMTEDLVGAILDWRDKDDAQLPMGAEAGYYRNLPYPYEIRNGPFRTIRELLLVRGITEDLLYGEDTNLNDRLDYNEKDGRETPPADNGDNKLDYGLIKYFTFCSYEKNKDAEGNDRVNINKADQDKLEDELDIKKSQAKWIVDNRRKGYKSISDLINKNSPKRTKGDNDSSDTAEPLDLETFYKTADMMTVSDAEKLWGRININTAPEEVLCALLGGGEKAMQTARDIIDYRDTLADGMISIAEILEAKVVKIKDFKSIANHICTRSDIYTIRSWGNTGTSRGLRIVSEVIIDRTPDSEHVLYSFQGVAR